MSTGFETADNSHVLTRFRHRLGPLWDDVAPHCVEAGAEDLPRLKNQIRRCSRPECATNAQLARELEALLAGWPHYGSCERMILRGAVDYLAEDEAQSPRAGVARDGDVVVEATVRTLLRRA
ncbi:hypothetical protein [Gephyromycinifex aptenodytis]|uniref:hypothetical protein n=1 Tax=Gephyromycinifex aptenodytis TaxID=2716227 RepID=UPI00144828F5|nr:hypothetical protein [Gephyromycinifex aptenodytis]